MQGVYSYKPETNHVSKVYDVAGTVVTIQYIAHVMLFPMINVLYFYTSTYQSHVQCLA
jgi:hypothetical protein